MGYLSNLDQDSFPEVSAEQTSWPAKWRGVKVLPTTDPKYCPVCENGVKNELRLKRLRGIYKDDGSFEQLKNYTEILQLHEHRKGIDNQKEQRKALEKQCRSRDACHHDGFRLLRAGRLESA